MEKQAPAGPDQEPIPGKGQEIPSEPGQDQAWQRVYFGQVASPLVPPHPGPPESPEEELTRAAMEDPGASVREMPDVRPTFWRAVFLIVLAVAALAMVFWRR